jgi:hypothetical protein
MPRIVAYMDGGIIQGFSSDTPDTELLVVDADTEGATEEELIKLSDYSWETYLSWPEGKYDPDFVERVFKEAESS